jgi:hypothetical protein
VLDAVVRQAFGMANAWSRALQELLDTQSGIISRRQATLAGMTGTAIDNKLRSQRWQPLQRGVYASFSGAPDRLAELWAVVLKAGPKAALSYQTAGELYGLVPKPGGPIHVTVPVGRRTGPIRGALVHHSRSIDKTRHPVFRPPRTRIEETVLDLTQVAATMDQAFDWLARAVGRGLTTEAHVRTALVDRQRARWRGDLLIALDDIADGARSVLERRYITGVEQGHGLPAARRQARIVTGTQSRYVDNLYDEAGLAVELDGRTSHPPEQRRADSRRDNDHASLGIVTLRYSWLDITARPCTVATEIAGILDQRGTTARLRRCGPGCTAVGP